MPSVAALLHYPHWTPGHLQAVHQLEQDGPTCPAFVLLGTVRTQRARRTAPTRAELPRWIAAYEPHPEAFVPRPPLPTLLYALRLPPGVVLSFGRDVLRLHPFVDLYDFAHLPHVRDVVLDALDELAQRFAAIDVVVSHTAHPLVYELGETRGFADVIALDHADCGGEVAEPEALYAPMARSPSGWWRYARR